MIKDKSKQENPVKIILLLILITAEINSLEIITELPELRSNTFTLRNEEPINVTLGEHFSIGIPQFDIQKLPRDLKVYEISQ